MEKYKNNETVELNTLFIEMTITPNPKKAIREHCAPVLISRSPIVYPTNYAQEYSIDCDLITEVRNHAFAGTEEEDPQAHLMMFDTLCGTFKLKDVSREFVLLRLATCRLRWYFPEEERMMQYSRDKYFP